MTNFASDVDQVVLEIVRSAYMPLAEEMSGKSVDYDDLYTPEIWRPYGLTKGQNEELWKRLYLSWLFYSLPLVPGARIGVQTLAHRNGISFVTSRPASLALNNASEVDLGAITSKSIDRFFSDIVYNIHRSGEIVNGNGKSRLKTKAEICANIKADFLIEDNPLYALECAETTDYPVQVLLFSHPYNNPQTLERCLTGGIVDSRDRRHAQKLLEIERKLETHSRITRVHNWDEILEVLKRK